jgi:hypothetical protein
MIFFLHRTIAAGEKKTKQNETKRNKTKQRRPRTAAASSDPTALRKTPLFSTFHMFVPSLAW